MFDFVALVAFLQLRYLAWPLAFFVLLFGLRILLASSDTLWQACARQWPDATTWVDLNLRRAADDGFVLCQHVRTATILFRRRMTFALVIVQIAYRLLCNFAWAQCVWLKRVCLARIRGEEPVSAGTVKGSTASLQPSEPLSPMKSGTRVIARRRTLRTRRISIHRMAKSALNDADEQVEETGTYCDADELVASTSAVTPRANNRSDVQAKERLDVSSPSAVQIQQEELDAAVAPQTQTDVHACVVGLPKDVLGPDQVQDQSQGQSQIQDQEGVVQSSESSESIESSAQGSQLRPQDSIEEEVPGWVTETIAEISC